jgi:hypothetical protein
MKGTRLKETAAEYAARSKEGVVAALRDARAARLAVPRRQDHAHRLLFGVAVPLTLLRLTWSDATTRRSMLHRLMAPVLCLSLATVVGVVWAVRSHDAGEHHTASLHAGGDADDADDDDGDDDAKANVVLPPAASAALARAAELEGRAGAPLPAPPTAAPPAPPRPAGRFSALRTAIAVLTSRAVKVLAVLGVVEWILVWIGREHHDHMAYEISILTRVPGEAPPGPPRLRLDFGWLWLKAWRAARFFLFLALVSPFAWLVGLIPVVGPALSVAVEGTWAAYWASVFAVANTFLVWEPRPHEPPWFIRGLRFLGNVPVIGWPFRLYARLLAFATRAVWPACTAFEFAPWEAAGLALARGIASVPFFYLILRPMFGPAATHALVGRTNADGLPATPVASEPVPETNASGSGEPGQPSG